MSPLISQARLENLLLLCSFTLIALCMAPSAACAPIHDAVRSGDLQRVKALLSSNSALASNVDDRGNTPLHYAAAAGFKDIAEVLIENGAYVNSTDKHLRTPLHLAASNGQKEIVDLLLSHQAEVNPVDDIGWTPMRTAEVRNHPDIVELLRQHGGVLDAPVPSASPAPNPAGPGGNSTTDATATGYDTYTYKSVFTQATKTSKKGKVLESTNYVVTVTFRAVSPLAPFEDNFGAGGLEATYGESPDLALFRFSRSEIKCSILAVDGSTGLPTKWQIVIDHADQFQPIRFVLTSEGNSMKSAQTVGSLELETALSGSDGVWQVTR